MKNFLKLLLLAGLITYLVLAFTKFTKHGNHKVCHNIEYFISDSSHAGFITKDEADRILRHSNLYPIGRKMDQINGMQITRVLRKNAFIDSVACYKSPNGTVHVLIQQRMPVLRVISDNGEQYYMDMKGNVMDPQGYAADLVVATGNFDQKFAKNHLLHMGKFIRNNEFWNGQIQQIHVKDSTHLELIPRVGKSIIEFGDSDQMLRKFQNLYAFYTKVLPEVGWNKYEKISIENVTQIVGTKARQHKR